ncbi:Scr1 family TA system antitoxin-like transcriptional regulator [Streptomyces mirabilis]
MSGDGDGPHARAVFGYWVLHESVLRTRVADRATALAQLGELLRQSERPNVDLRVIPFEVDGFAGACSSLVYVGVRLGLRGRLRSTRRHANTLP